MTALGGAVVTAGAIAGAAFGIWASRWRWPRHAIAVSSRMAGRGRPGEGPTHRAGRANRLDLLAPIAAGVFAVPLGLPAALAFVGLALLGGRWLARRRRHRTAAATDFAARSLAQALAASLAAGNSLHGALANAPGSVDAPLRVHVERAASELEFGYRVDEVLARMARRARAPRVDLLVGALAMQRRAGGDLVRLLGELVESFRRDDHTRDQARSATAQARLTAWIVIGAPPAVAVLVELAWRGALSGVLSAPLATAVFATALAMNGVGAWLVLRLAAVGE